MRGVEWGERGGKPSGARARLHLLLGEVLAQQAHYELHLLLAQSAALGRRPRCLRRRLGIHCILRVLKILRHRFAQTVILCFALLERIISACGVDGGHQQQLLDVEDILPTARVLLPVQAPQRKLALGVTELAQLHICICVW